MFINNAEEEDQAMGSITVKARFECGKCGEKNSSEIIITDSLHSNNVQCDSCQTIFKPCFQDEEGSLSFSLTEVCKDKLIVF